MKVTSVVLAVIGFAMALPQTATENASPTGSASAECTGSVSGPFQAAVKLMGQSSTKRDVLQNRGTCDNAGLLEMTLNGTVLKDATGRTGYIASNYQFQFDGPPQSGAISSSGFSLCDNSLLALNDNTVWYQCQSGNFYNLYSKNWAKQCQPIELVVLYCNGTQAPGGEPVLNTNVSLPVCQISDGQIQAHTTACVTMTTAAPQSGTTINASTPPTTSVTTTTPSTTVLVPSTSTATAGSTSNTTATASGAQNATNTGSGSSSTTTAASSSVSRISAGSSVAALAVGLIAALWAV